jgi:hypothetical protein
MRWPPITERSSWFSNSPPDSFTTLESTQRLSNCFPLVDRDIRKFMRRGHWPMAVRINTVVAGESAYASIDCQSIVASAHQSGLG